MIHIDKEQIKERIKSAEKCLIDNGIEPDEAEIVLQALGYILLDTDLYQYNDEGQSANVLEKYLVNRITELIHKIDNYVKTVDKKEGKKRISYYLNIEHCIGEYHAHIKCLAEFSSDKFMTLHSEFEGHISSALQKLESLYQLIN